MNNKKSKTIGTQAELYVKEKLWRNGFRVKDFSILGYRNGFDLLINDRIRLEVKYSKCHWNKTWFYWDIHGVKPDNFDVLCVVLEVPIDGYKVYYLKNKNLINDFCKNQRKSNFSIHITEARISQYFTDKPKESFHTFIN